jgi:hypothetical protein
MQHARIYLLNIMDFEDLHYSLDTGRNLGIPINVMRQEHGFQVAFSVNQKPVILFIDVNFAILYIVGHFLHFGFG